MRSILSLTLALPLLAACALPGMLPGLPQKATPKASSNCPDLVAHALASPSEPVAGSFACLSADLQAAASKVTNASGDAALLAIARQAPVYSSYSPRGVTADGGFVYVLDGSADGKPQSQVLVLHVANGRVAAIASA